LTCGVARVRVVYMMTPADATAFVAALLREIDPTADVVECALAPDGLGYRLQLRIHGDITKVGRVPAGLLVEAAAGNSVAAHASRLMLQSLLLEVETRRAQEFARRTRHQRPRRRTPPPAPP
jgi:hypothetical protein